MTRLTLLAFALAPFAALAQEQGGEGVVRYSHTFAPMSMPTDQVTAFLDERFGKEHTPDPTHATLPRKLVFSSLSSLQHSTEDLSGNEDDWWEIIDSTYVNFEEGSYVESCRFGFGEHVFLISDEWPRLSWRLLREERTHLGYRVMKATAELNSGVVEAWFAPEIPVPAGPGLYGGLPGLILMLTNAAKEEMYVADSIALGIQTYQIKPPITGRTTSRDKYDRFVKRERAANQRDWEFVKDKLEGSSIKVLGTPPRGNQLP